jgi:hypothetical protein
MQTFQPFWMLSRSMNESLCACRLRAICLCQYLDAVSATHARTHTHACMCVCVRERECVCVCICFVFGDVNMSAFPCSSALRICASRIRRAISRLWMRVYPPKVCAGGNFHGASSAAQTEKYGKVLSQGGHPAANSCMTSQYDSLLQRGASDLHLLRSYEPLQQPPQHQQKHFFAEMHVLQPNDAILRQPVAVPPLPPFLAFPPKFFSPPPTPPLSPSVSSSIANASRNQRSLEQVSKF